MVALDLVVATVATDLMAATSANAVEVSRRVLARLVDHFDVDVSFLRHNDHTIRASRLIAEWPPRPDSPDPDPLAFIYFDDADPVFALSETSRSRPYGTPGPPTIHTGAGSRRVGMCR